MLSTTARFGFTDRAPGVRFECHLDRERWKGCRTPAIFTALAAGGHSFAVRALDGRGRRSPVARFRWKLLAPKTFSITPRLTNLDPLFPGAPPAALPLAVTNPNPVPIFITSLRAIATTDPLGCTSAENLAIYRSSASSSQPLEVPARGSVSLPAQGISPPAIQLRNLPVNQDACQSAQFPLVFSGRARG